MQPGFVVALWGIESDFGKTTGSYAVMTALATLAYDGRRASFFRPELISAMRILDQGHIRPNEMMGSWAGAMGQCQFMPSTFLSYAVDFDGDGRRDIWTDRADVFGSIAQHYLRPGLAGAATRAGASGSRYPAQSRHQPGRARHAAAACGMEPSRGASNRWRGAARPRRGRLARDPGRPDRPGNSRHR